MSLTVVGSIASTRRTPFGKHKMLAGPRSTSLAASFFTAVRAVGPVGDDFGLDEFAILESRGGRDRRHRACRGGKTFFGAPTTATISPSRTPTRRSSTCSANSSPSSDASRTADALFLGNIQPSSNAASALNATPGSSRLDSMNLWIETTRRHARGRHRRGRLPDAQRRRASHADRGAEPRPCRPRGDGDGSRDRRGEARRVRRGAVHRRRILRDPRIPPRTSAT